MTAKISERFFSHSDDALRLFVDYVTDYSIFMLDPSGIVSTWNAGAERLSGYNAGEIIGKHFSIFYPKTADRMQHIEYELRKAKEVGKYWEEGIRIRKDGTEYWASVCINAIYDQAGELRGFAKITQDISERKASEKRLQESELRLRLLIESVKDYAIFMLDQRGVVASWNAGAERIKGYKDSEIIGKHFSIFYPEELKNINHPQRELEAATRYGRYEEEGLRIRKDGTAFHANVVITALFDRERRLIGFTKVTRDITERKLAEERLKRINEELERKVEARTSELNAAKNAAEESNRTKIAFLANMSHEIRTPLNALIGFSEIVANNHQTDSEKEESREAILRNGKLLIRLVDDILDFAKVETGHLKIMKSEILLSDLLSQVGATCNLQAKEKGLRFSISSEGRLPLRIVTDPARLKQILFNVIGNALKFTSRGSVLVTVSEIQQGDKVTLLFGVRDTGPGIAPEVASKLFAVFSQGDESLTRRFGGSGLGLALSRRLARALGGDIQLTESTVGKGSLFTISIDIGVRRFVLFETETDDFHEMRSPEEKTALINLEGIKVLIVEDAADSRTLMKRYLQKVGATVDYADNGQEGVEKALNGKPDIVMMDISMPVKNGYEAVSELRKHGFTKPIVALTGHALEEQKQHCLDAGFTDHLTKPVNQLSLLKTILHLV